MSLPPHILRNSGIAFIGLGRMGFAMADNLFVKTLHAKLSRPDASSQATTLIVCDAFKNTAVEFARAFHFRNQDLPRQASRMRVEVVDTPAE
jgi:pyrroline-5-carboxylate reductase